MKVSIIGAGNVGATLAKRIVEENIADVVLLDVLKDLAQGKALDLLHAAPIINHQRKILGTDNYDDIKGSNIIVITAGRPRLPGMSRGDLVRENGKIVKQIAKNIKEKSPDAITIVVTNPVDIMSYIVIKETGFSRNRVIGMAGVLDSSRFAYLIGRELKVDYKDIETTVLGQHGPGMVPLISHTKVKNRPIDKLIAKEKIDELIKELRESGARIVGLLGKGSAYYAPSAAVFFMIKLILHDLKGLISASCLAKGEYGLSDICIGLPVRLGKKGIIEIVELPLDENERRALNESAKMIKEQTAKL